jgi:indolepyruvate ferredoxin oxidoreductase
METGFIDQLRQAFDGDFRINYHLAPPMLPLGKDRRGRPRKIRLGPWVQLPFRVLAKLKGLRGTAFDPFGHTAERRMERALIGWYEDLIATLLDHLPRRGSTPLLPIATAPMDIRGYGPVKDKAVAEVRARVAALIAGLTDDGPRQPA